MNIEQKLAYIKRALELGADVSVSFHNVSEKKQAKEIAVEFSKMCGLKHKQNSRNGSNWYKLKTDDYSFEMAVFYDEYMEEDVDLSGNAEQLA